MTIHLDMDNPNIQRGTSLADLCIENDSGTMKARTVSTARAEWLHSISGHRVFARQLAQRRMEW